MDLDDIHDSQSDSELNEDSADDSSLRTKFSNSTLQTQANWVGRRGKPRCDHCRVNNLKCDRVLPTCNHCTYSPSKPCTYTPLPTPAHRGIPRCDRCRDKNFKCDRNLPICNYCKTDNITQCNYTPKKRPKANNPMFPQQMEFTAQLTPASLPIPPTISPTPQNGHMNGTTPPSWPVEQPLPAPPVQPPLPPPTISTIRFHHETVSSVLNKPSSRQSINRVADWASANAFPDHGLFLTNASISPWVHPSFIPLPPHILQRLNSIPAADMPHRMSFNEHLDQMVNTLMPELRETAAFSPEVYAAMSRGLQKNDMQFLSLRRRTWAVVHRIRSGSSRAFLLLMPRELVFSKNSVDEERLRIVYQEKMDITFPSQPSRTLKIDPAFDPISFKDDMYNCLTDDPEWMMPFERIPVQLQIYDVLAYAHRSHKTSLGMVEEVRKCGVATITWPMCETFVRLCPVCSSGGGGGNLYGR